MAIYGNKIGEINALSVMNKQFRDDIDAGLSKPMKTLPSKYFYDEIGDDLFVKIMNMPEYYLTKSEHEIFRDQTEDLIKAFDFGENDYTIVELGAGDGTKTLELLRKVDQSKATYKPIDISQHAIINLLNRLKKEVPDLHVEGKQGEYFKVLDSLKSEYPKIILFMGSNIGNLQDDRAASFMKQVSEVMQPGDKILVGFDLKKEASVVLPAYNDPHGYTRDFNLNLLTRINRELGGDFDLSKFKHDPEYNPETGLAASYITSLEDQEVEIEATEKTYRFIKGERIHTEISRKYDDNSINAIIRDTGLERHASFTDSKNYFTDIIFVKK